MSVMVSQYQNRVLAPSEVVDYSQLIRTLYPPIAIQREAFFGFKVLCTDTKAFTAHPSERLRFIDANLGILKNKGVIIRESDMSKNDGYWVIALPVPRSQIKQSLNNLFDVLASLETYLGIVKDGLFEINVSGRCPMNEMENRFKGLLIPERYRTNLIPTNNVFCNIGQIQRINDQYICIRTRWDMRNSQTPNQIFDDIIAITQCLSSIHQ